MYAGENLARDFSDSSSAVNAWMQSTKHRDNILQSQYTDVGFAIKEGVLQGKPTVIVVQLFGTPDPQYVAARPQPQTNIQGAVIKKPLFDIRAISKQASVGILMLLVITLAIDLYVMERRRNSFNVTKAYTHLVLLAVIIAGILVINPGSIL